MHDAKCVFLVVYNGIVDVAAVYGLNSHVDFAAVYGLNSHVDFAAVYGLNRHVWHWISEGKTADQHA